MKTVRVLQSFSVCHQGIWYNQGDTFQAGDATEFLTKRAKYDAKDKYLGDEIVCPVETVAIQAETISAASAAHEEG